MPTHRTYGPWIISVMLVGAAACGGGASTYSLPSVIEGSSAPDGSTGTATSNSNGGGNSGTPVGSNDDGGSGSNTDSGSNSGSGSCRGSRDGGHVDGGADDFDDEDHGS